MASAFEKPTCLAGYWRPYTMYFIIICLKLQTESSVGSLVPRPRPLKEGKGSGTLGAFLGLADSALM